MTTIIWIIVIAIWLGSWLFSVVLVLADEGITRLEWSIYTKIGVSVLLLGLWPVCFGYYVICRARLSKGKKGKHMNQSDTLFLRTAGTTPNAPLFDRIFVKETTEKGALVWREVTDKTERVLILMRSEGRSFPVDSAPTPDFMQWCVERGLDGARILADLKLRGVVTEADGRVSFSNDGVRSLSICLLRGAVNYLFSV